LALALFAQADLVDGGDRGRRGNTDGSDQQPYDPDERPKGLAGLADGAIANIGFGRRFTAAT